MHTVYDKTSLMIFCTHKFKIQEHNTIVKEVIWFYLKPLILFCTSSTIIIFLFCTVICCYYVPQNWIGHIILYIKKGEKKKKKEGTKYFGKGSNKNNPLHSFPIFKFPLNAFFVEAYNAMQCNAMTWMMFHLSHNKSYYNVMHHYGS